MDFGRAYNRANYHENTDRRIKPFYFTYTNGAPMLIDGVIFHGPGMRLLIFFSFDFDHFNPPGLHKIYYQTFSGSPFYLFPVAPSEVRLPVWICLHRTVDIRRHDL